MLPVCKERHSGPRVRSLQSRRWCGWVVVEEEVRRARSLRQPLTFYEVLKCLVSR